MVDYTKLMFDVATTERLFAFCKRHRLGLADVPDQSGLSADEFGFHVTVMYSKVAHPSFKEGVIGFGPHVVVPIAFEMFGPAKDLLALTLRSDPILDGLLRHYRETYGHVSDFAFSPHVTIPGEVSRLRGRSHELPLPDFELRLDRLVQRVKNP